MPFLQVGTRNGFITCFLISLSTIGFGYPSVIVASTLAKPAFLKYMGLGDENGIFDGKEGMAGTITGLFQVSEHSASIGMRDRFTNQCT